MKKLILAEVIEKRPFSEGQRVLLDFMEQFNPHEYLLVGNTHYGFFAVASENHETVDYLPRSFRFNIGALHQYVVIDNNRVKYADELKSGDEIFVGGKEGARRLTIGRVKKEIRPFVRLKCILDGKEVSAILQHETTVALLTEAGMKPVTEIDVGSKVLILPWGNASHLGAIKNEFCEEL